MFYYVLLVLTLAALALSRMACCAGASGYYWQAIREDQAAAPALGDRRVPLQDCAVALSAVMTAVAGTLLAFYDNNLYPDTDFGISRSIDIITAPIIGGIGTLIGPILGAVVLTALSETMTNVSASLGINGLKQFIYGAALLVIVMLQPAGLWPWLKARLEARRGRDVSVPLLSVDGISKRFSGLQAVDGVSFTVPPGAIVGLIGPNGAGKTTIFNLIAGVFRPDAGTIRLGDRDITGLRPDLACGAGIGRTFQVVRPFGALTVLDNVMVGAFKRTASPAAARRAAMRILERIGLADKANAVAASLTLPDRKRLETARALATGPQAPAARRGDGRAAAGRDRCHGTGIRRPVPRYGTCYPSHRACHARRHGAVPAHRRGASRPEDLRRAARNGGAR